MTRYVGADNPREGNRYYERNCELGQQFTVKRCHRADGTVGVAVLARKLMFVLTPAEAIEVADGLVDAVEAIRGQS